MPAKRRKRLAVVDAEEELLSKGRWSQYLANQQLHRPEENIDAQERCRQLINGEQISWDELIGRQ